MLSSLQLMQDYGVNLICVEDNIDSSKEAGKLLISIIAGSLFFSRTCDPVYHGTALRVFSVFLIDPDIDGTFGRFIYGKNLLKMTSEEILEDSETKQAAVVASEETLKKIIDLFEEV